MTLEVLDGDEALVDLQLRLAAYTQVVMKNLCDTVPKLVYNQMVTKVRSCISPGSLHSMRKPVRLLMRKSSFAAFT